MDVYLSVPLDDRKVMSRALSAYIGILVRDSSHPNGTAEYERARVLFNKIRDTLEPNQTRAEVLEEMNK